MAGTVLPPAHAWPMGHSVPTDVELAPDAQYVPAAMRRVQGKQSLGVGDALEGLYWPSEQS